ncbi:tetratricopeptide repeat protein [Streptomyces broussonetiae]|uniref:tetratricopeptide repeat protein n=1 Tax=Streptomyces broussonetiae TaxID=2686304 RepID=UPI0035D9D853
MPEQAWTALAETGAAAVVRAVGTDTWPGLRAAVARWSARGDEQRERAERERLDRTAGELRSVAAAQVQSVRSRLQAAWQARVEALLGGLEPVERVRAAEELRAVLAEHDRAVPAAAGQDGLAAGGTVDVRAEDRPRRHAHGTPLRAGGDPAPNGPAAPSPPRPTAEPSVPGNRPTSPSLPGIDQGHVLVATGGVVAHYGTGASNTAGAALSAVAQDWEPVADVDLLGLGVHRARTADGDGSGLPPYVLRDVDGRVRAELRAAAESGGFVLLTGDSTAGKTRTALEAVRAVLPGHLLLAPPWGADLRPLGRAPGEPVYDRHVLWLDDLEHYLRAGGLEPSLLTSLIRARLVVLATLRDERYDSLREAADDVSGAGGHGRMEAETGLRVLNMVEPVVVRRLWSDAELARVAQADDSRLHEAHARHGTHGIAEYLAAGPELLAEWRRAGRSTAGRGHPRGAALVAAAVDLARVGMIGDLPVALLHEVHHHHLKALGGAALRPESFADAVAWASQVRYGVASLLMEGEEEGTKRPFDYLVDSVARDPAAPNVPEPVWLTALKYADEATRPLIAQAASFGERWAIAELAWRPLAESGDEEAVINYTSSQLFQHRDPAEIEALLRPVAEAGHPVAQVNLAAVLKIRGADEEAVRWWSDAAEAGLALAAFNLFTHYRNTGDDERAETFLRNAAEGGYPRAMATLATLLHVRGDEAEAEPWWQAAAMAGDTEAMYVHGHLLRLRGDDRAEPWLRRAAERGHDRAAEILGRAADERGDLVRAEAWWRAAAEAGNAEAANELGVLLSRRGERAEGATWYARGAESGHDVAMFNLAVWLSDQGDVEGAEKWYRRAGEAGNAQGLTNLGALLRAADDTAGAEAAWRRAAQAGDTTGCLNLIDLLICAGRSAEARPLLLHLLDDADDMEEITTFVLAALRWGRPQVTEAILRWAAESGRIDAAHNLGSHYYAQGMPQEAERWWRVSAPEFPVSAHNLGLLLSERGEAEEAATWWRKAAEQGHRQATLLLADQYIGSGRPQEAEGLLRQLADEIPEAAFTLGLLLFDKPDGSTEATYWWQRAQEQADADTAFGWASCLAERGDEEKTELWCRKAAEAGHPRAAFNLGALLAGRGELAGAETWLAEALHRGHEEAAQPLAAVREFLATRHST